MKLIKKLAVAGTAGTFVALLATPAFAHVTVNPSEAAQGGYSRLTFRVPDESDTASTTKVAVAFPTDHPIASVRTKPVPGWTATVVKAAPATPLSNHDGSPITEVVSEIVWTATTPGTAVQPGEFQEFDVSVGPLPEADSVTFKAVQTYSDGTVVRWIDEPAADGAEVEHPAPVLTLTPAEGEDHHAAATTGDDADESSEAAESTEDDDSNAALIVAVAALIVAVAGVALGLARRRS
jgi:uncharacterized protein YcnI